ncbi:carbon starvation protein CstA [Brevundimonas vesicularis]|nr:carbon starvation protein CstA [Brevundimonas vesicularis]
MGKLSTPIIFGAIAILGAVSLGIIALHQGESISAVWMVIAAVCTYAIAYRFYSRYLANKVMQLNPARLTPAMRRNDGLDYVPTPKNVLFGHHFAAIAGAGPLVGPVLAAQMGYLPGVLWILVGAVLAGAVQDMMVLFMSTRRDGKSLGDMIRTEMGNIPGIIAQVGVLMIMVIILAVLALVVVKALAESPWGTFTVAATIPIAIFMGLYTRFLRPGRVGEVSVIGVVLLILAIIGGGHIAADPFWGPAFTLTGPTLAILMMVYGFIASVIPVWLLLAPRDYLSTFLKIGAIVALAVGILIVRPHLQMPAITPFIDGTGPVFGRRPVPLPVHHHRLRRGVGLPRFDIVGHHAQAAGERSPDPDDRLRRHAVRKLRRRHGPDRRHGAGPGRLFRHEQPGRRHRQRCGLSRRRRGPVGLPHHARRA